MYLARQNMSGQNARFGGARNLYKTGETDSESLKDDRYNNREQ